MPQMPRVQKVIDFLTEHEIEAIKNVILSDDGKMPLRDKAICALAMFTGLRSIDIVNLKFDDLHWDSNEIVFVQTKTSHIVRVPMRPLVGNYLYRYITEERPQVKSEQIFITKGKWPRLMQATMTYNISKKLFKIAGLRNDGRRKGLHLLRHNLAAIMLCNDIDMSVISSILGHKSPKTVEKYLSCDIELLRGCSISIADYPVTNLIYTDTYEITYV